MNGNSGSLRGLLIAVVMLAGCYESSSREDEGDADVRDIREVDVLHDSAAEDVPDVGPDVVMDVPLACRPQEAWEDPYIDCDMCNPCDARPYIWQGDRCTYQPICCRCAGPDCANLFVTLDECLAAYRDCPMAAGEGPDYPGARLLWQAPGGFAGMGPALMVDGEGLVRSWNFVAGLPGLDDPTWSRTDYDYSENLGIEATNDFFALLEAVDHSVLPHPPGPWAECYPSLVFRTCSTCEAIGLDYNSAVDLLPEMRAVYEWLDERLCRGLSASALPSDYCVFEL
jgi:hypothetical protein